MFLIFTGWKIIASCMMAIMTMLMLVMLMLMEMKVEKMKVEDLPPLFPFLWLPLRC